MPLRPQAERVDLVDGIAIDVGVEIEAAVEADRIFV
jgi:hypothetical protein